LYREGGYTNFEERVSRIEEQGARSVSVELRIQGMSCGHCVRAVRNALASVPSVQVNDVQVGSATVETDGSPAAIDAIIAALDDAGYTAELRAG
jgi:copper chaperone CopZ